MAHPRDVVSAHDHLRRYVLANERVVVATRLHWAVLLEPIATTIGVFLLVAVIIKAVPAEVYDATLWLWVVWLVVAGRLLWRWLEWFNEWFVATDKRLLLLYGVVVHKVAMMPLGKVTDMGYSRTPLGHILGFGRFVMESAGQDQALRQVDWVPRPDKTYRLLCATIFLPVFGHLHGTGSSHRPPALMPGPRTGEPAPTTMPIQLRPQNPQPRPDDAGATGTGGSVVPKPFL